MIFVKGSKPEKRRALPIIFPASGHDAASLVRNASHSALLFLMVIACSTARVLLPQLALAIGAGLALRGAVGLEPMWWWAWLAPVPLLWLAFRTSVLRSMCLTALAATIGTSVNAAYYQQLMPPAAAVGLVLYQAMLWVLVVQATRGLVVRYRAWWTVLVYPVVWAGLDTLTAAFMPDGNWGSLAYSQLAFLPALQLTALLGVPGLLFVLALVPATITSALCYGRHLRHAGWAYGLTVITVGGTLAYGSWRLRTIPSGPETTFGLVAIDTGKGLTPSVTRSTIWQQYEQHIMALANQGAQVVVLPEKIASLSAEQADTLQQRLGQLANRRHLWLAIGVELKVPANHGNMLWLFAPTGHLSAMYQKHYLAPPERAERSMQASHAFTVQQIADAEYGLAICKDMHFEALGRVYGQLQVAAMLVPAWDFDADRRLGMGMTATRGVENGYVVVRAARQGLLTVSDAYGRILSEQVSSSLPGSTLLARVAVGRPIATFFTRGGYLFGWICVGGSAFFLLVIPLSGWRRHRQVSWQSS